MSLSDCEKCWDTPCTCGWDYKHYSKERLVEMRDIFQQLIDGTHKYSIKKNSCSSYGIESKTATQPQNKPDL
jgi:hypothetical protein